MATQYDKIEPPFRKFIEKQHIFFTGTAATDGRVNVSPKGMDALRVLSPNRIIWRNLTGSGNETTAHLDEIPRMTLMWCAFSGQPMIYRAYGTARAVHRLDPDWEELNAHFPKDRAARQVFDLTVDMAMKSCGYGVPEMSFETDRAVMTDWGASRTDEEIHAYWTEKNAESIDGKPTGIAERNLGT